MIRRQQISKSFYIGTCKCLGVADLDMSKIYKNKRKKPNVTLTNSELNKFKQESIWWAMIMFLATAMDEMGWTENDIDNFAVRLDRYMSAVQDHVITINKVSQIIEEQLGVKIYMH